MSKKDQISTTIEQRDWKVELHGEGLTIDDALREELLACVRNIQCSERECSLVSIRIKRIDGRVQSRIGITLARRRISALVYRDDPLSATRAGIVAINKSLDQDEVFLRPSNSTSLIDNLIFPYTGPGVY